LTEHAWALSLSHMLKEFQKNSDWRVIQRYQDCIQDKAHSM
jgi:hypothetical protein